FLVRSPFLQYVAWWFGSQHLKHLNLDSEASGACGVVADLAAGCMLVEAGFAPERVEQP
ncbi:hypothetical protein U1Q18_017955, partial [Sarracenia purpurea var. burkii]